MVFSGGTQPAPDHEILKLSDAFESEGDAPKDKDKPLPLELVVDVYNINVGHNSAIQEACETLKGYANFVSRVRENPHSQANAYEFDISHSETSNSHPFFILSSLSILPVAT